MGLSLVMLSLTTILGLATGCCVFNGVAYQEGEMIIDACVKLYCKQTKPGVYQWFANNTINEECDECCVRNDPHITTFDGGYYDWHGTCRYSLAEYIDSWGASNPPPTEFAVYGDFRQCGAQLNPPSCVHYTSYQLDALLDNVLHVDHGSVSTIYNYNFGFSTLITSSEPTPVVIGSVNYDALAWIYNGCLRIQGPDLLIHICGHYVCIYTSTINLDYLGGLCGKYNDDVRDDHTDRDNVLYGFNDNVPAFAPTWQVDPLPPPYGDTDKECAGKEFECREGLDEYKEICAKYLERCTADKETLINIIDSCAVDLCAFPKEQQLWLDVALDFCLYQANKFGPKRG